MRNVKYDYSSVHVEAPEGLANEIIEWGKKNIPNKDVCINDSDGSMGREDEMHVTLLYGIHSGKSDEAKEILKGKGKIKVKLGKIEVFTNDTFDVVKIAVTSSDLHYLNRRLRNSVEFTNKYSKYQPHMTIAYVKKNTGWKHYGDDVFAGRKFECSEVIFSSKEGDKSEINLS